ncbi:MAG: restriction endonuclease subunit S, partial [Bacteroidota bacterium]|nr:restriction endonuclease subunit S [Bacteroidota bacterium]
ITQSKRKKGNIPYYGASGIVDYVDGYIFDEDLLLVSEDGANLLMRTYPIAFSISGKTWVNNHAHVLRFDNLHSQRFVEYYLNSIKLDDYVGGMAQPKLNQAMLNNIPIPYPPLSEQKRIVALLDEAFAAIDKAKANIEKNLQNAKELFEVFLKKDYPKKARLGELVNITTGRLNANAAKENGKYPFFTCSREVFAIDDYSFDCEAILLAGNNAVGDFNVKHYRGKFNAYQRTYVITAKDETKLDYRFLYYQMEKSLTGLKEQSVGAGTKFLKLPVIHCFEIAYPSIEEQRKMAHQLDGLAFEIKKLKTIYQQKLINLDQLKKSLLQKAFTGELTANTKALTT